MNKDRAFITGLVAFLLIGSLIATTSSDGIFAAVSVAFFLLCVAYAEGCERL